LSPSLEQIQMALGYVSFALVAQMHFAA